MKILNYSLLIAFGICSMGCIEEIPVNDQRFVKIYGKESGSFGNALYEAPDGHIIIGAKVDVPALDFTNEGGILVVDKVVEGSIATIEVDQNGNQVRLTALPISRHQSVPGVEFRNIQNKAKVNQIVPTDDGGLMLLCEWRGIDIILADTVFRSNDFRAVTPFMVKLRENNTIDYIRSFNGDPGWDGVYRARARMKILPNNNLGVLFGVNSYGASFTNIIQGYSFLELTQAGDTVFFQDFYDDRFKYKSANDFVMSSDDYLTLVGQTGSDLQVMGRDLKNPNQEDWQHLDNSGIFGGGWNDNPMFIEEYADGSYVVVYTNPAREVRIKFLTPEWGSSDPLIFNKLVDEYPRAVALTRNEDLLVYTIHLSETTVPDGYLYRISRDGQTKFRVRLEGTPGDVIEAQDGSILVLSNPLFNGLIPKTRLTKLSSDGKVY